MISRRRTSHSAGNLRRRCRIFWGIDAQLVATPPCADTAQSTILPCAINRSTVPTDPIQRCKILRAVVASCSRFRSLVIQSPEIWPAQLEENMRLDQANLQQWLYAKIGRSRNRRRNINGETDGHHAREAQLS